MTTNQLTYFCAVAQNLSFTAAANQLFVSQTAITQQVKVLEEMLGAQLFIRTKKRVELTPAGRVFYNEAKALLERTDMAFDKVKMASEGSEGALSIGYVKGYERSDFSEKLRHFHRQLPGVTIGCFRDSSDQLYQKTARNDYDGAFVLYNALSEKKEELVYLKIRDFSYVAALSRNHPFAGREFLTREMLQGEKEIQSEDTESILLMVAAEMGIAVLPEYAVFGALNSKELVFIPLQDEQIAASIYFIYHKNNENPILQQFLAFL